MARLTLSLLGPFQAALSGEAVTGFESNKVRALLAYLALEADRPHRRDSLAALLWPDWPDEAARGNLRHGLANLRKAIGDHLATPPYLSISRETIQFNTDSDYWLDVVAFTAAARASEGEPSPVRQQEDAIALYRGAFLAGFFLKGCPNFEDWAAMWRERLHRMALTALFHLAQHYEQRGDYQRACAYARRQMELEPWQEKAHQQLMRLLALSGERGAALAQYESCRRALAEELGVDPGQDTTRLYEEIRDGVLKGAAAPSTPQPGPRHNLPTSLVSFVGREVELREIGQWLEYPSCRLLTLVGPGGSGKTRLAVEAAARQIDRFEHGVWFVPLAALESPTGIVPTIAQVLHLDFAGKAEPEKQLLDFVRDRQALLILDNFEHLLEGVDIALHILDAAPDAKILVTSRSRLSVQGEQVFPVGGMDYPRLAAAPGPVLRGGELGASVPGSAQDVAEYSAVQLFVQSAQRLRVGFQPDEDDLLEIARICHLVQGMPLGILLAASWTDMLDPGAIAAEIERSLDFLATDWRHVPERQRSLRAVFDYSWEMLSAREREILAGLSVFRGGFTRHAAAEVTGSSLRDLKALSTKSLLQRNSAGRYELHELLRQYAAERLAQSPAASDRIRDFHSVYYLAALQRWSVDLKGRQEPTAVGKMAIEHEDLRAAWQWAIERGQAARLLGAMEGLSEFYWLRGRYQEAETAMQAAASSLTAVEQAASSDAVDRLRVTVRAAVHQSNFCRVLGRREEARQLQEQARALLNGGELAGQDTRFESALLLQTMGRTVLTSDYVRGARLFEQALALYRELGEEWRAANVMEALGRAAHFAGQAAEARQWFGQTLEMCRSLDDHSGVGRSTAWLALTAVRQGRFDKAERLAREASRTLSEHGDRPAAALGLELLGYTLEGVGKFSEARTVLDECLALVERRRPDYAASPRADLSRVDLHLGRYGEAIAHAKQGLAMAREAGPDFEVGYSLAVLGSVALASGSYAEALESLQESGAVFQRIGDKDGLSLATALLGWAARGQGHRLEALVHLGEALRSATDTGAVPPLLWALPLMALLLADQHEAERAVELYALAERYPFVANSKWFEEVVGQPLTAAAATLSPEAVAAARERGRARDLQTTVEQLLNELQKGSKP